MSDGLPPKETLEALLEGWQIVDADFRYVYVNNAVVAQAGTTREALIGRTMMEAFPGIDGTPMFERLRTAMKERVTLEMENTFTFPDGRVGYFSLRFVPVPEGVAILSFDVTERRTAEQSLVRKTRAHAALSASNRLLVRVVEEDRYMVELCRLVVEKCGYRSVWIALMRENAPFVLQMAARAGEPNDGISDEVVDLRDPRPGFDHVVDAVRENRSIVTHASTGDHAATNDSALRARSSATLPVANGDTVIGVMHISAVEIDAFDADELELLEEMALDLGFGLSTMRARVKAARTHSRLLTSNAQMARLAHATQDLSQCRSIDDVTAVVRRAARDLVDADGASIILREGNRCHYVDEDAISPLWKGKRFPIEACVSGIAMTEAIAVKIDDVYQDPRIPHDAYRPTFVKSMLVAPIRRVSPIGAIGCYWAAVRKPTDDDTRVIQALADATSVAFENVRMLTELHSTKNRTRAIYEHLPTPTLVFDGDGRHFTLSDVNESARTTFKLEDDARSLSRLLRAFPGVDDDIRRCFDSGEFHRREIECRIEPTQGIRRFDVVLGAVPPSMVVMHARDVTTERDLERQLRVVQRLEAVGQLAGGVAHDFNNLLSVIINYAAISLDALPKADPVWEDIAEIHRAGERAASLTRQLLAFGRKQVLEAKVLNLNLVVEGLFSMLKRLLREDIQIELQLAHDLGQISADPSQLEQILFNLAVNAGDAMPHGGLLRIETANTELDEDYASMHVGCAPGSYVRLTVADTGEGMDRATLERVFEPFFTTKGPSKGTGLGLSTVYGIVKQSGGNVWVYSELGRGTTFKVYLPRVDAPVSIPSTEHRAIAMGNEHVLLVEDSDAVRRLTERLLTRSGYRVTSTTSAKEAIEVLRASPDAFDVLLTDVIMPEMNGPDLAAKLREHAPQLRVLYMSGYTDNMIAHHGVLGEDVRFIGKPFTAHELTQKMRFVLEQGPSK